MAAAGRAETGVLIECGAALAAILRDTIAVFRQLNAAGRAKRRVIRNMGLTIRAGDTQSGIRIVERRRFLPTPDEEDKEGNQTPEKDNRCNQDRPIIQRAVLLECQEIK